MSRGELLIAAGASRSAGAQGLEGVGWPKLPA